MHVLRKPCRHLFGRIGIGLVATSPLSVIAVVLVIIVFGIRSSTIQIGTIVIVLATTSVIMHLAVIGTFYTSCTAIPLSIRLTSPAGLTCL